MQGGLFRQQISASRTVCLNDATRSCKGECVLRFAACRQGLHDEQCVLQTGLSTSVCSCRLRSGVLAGGGTLQEPLLAVLQQLADCAADIHAHSEGDCFYVVSLSCFVPQ
jgi:hypothetical protein